MINPKEMIVRHLISLMDGIEENDVDLIGQVAGALADAQMKNGTAWAAVSGLLENLAEQLNPPIIPQTIDECTGPDIDQFFWDMNHE